MGSAAISNFVGEYLAKMVYDKLPQNLKGISGMEKLVVGPVLSGLVTYGTFKLMGVEDGFMQPFIIGAGSSALASYTYDNAVKVWLMKGGKVY
jgi:hypothetical protein